MSMWTHVVGCIRIDGIPKICSSIENIEKIIGPMCLYDAWNEDSTLPRGSEGSLQYKIIEYHDGLPWLAIPIWGDLRDFDDLSRIKKWWNDLLLQVTAKNNSDSRAIIRDAVLFAKTEAGEEMLLKSDGEVS